jgi:hypothetical protein
MAWDLPPGVKHSECHLQFRCSLENIKFTKQRSSIELEDRTAETEVVGIDIGIESDFDPA